MLLPILLLIAGASEPLALCSLEEWSALPARTRGFMRDLRNLRLLMANPGNAGQIAGGREIYIQALGLIPPREKRESGLPWGEEAGIRYRLGDLAGAEEAARQGLALFPKEERLAFVLALVAHAREDWSQAERALSLAIALGSDGKTRKKRLDHLAWVRGRAKGSGGWIEELSGKWPGQEGLASAQEMCLLVPSDALAPLLAAYRARNAGDSHGALALADLVAGESGIRMDMVTRLQSELSKVVTADLAKGGKPSHPASLYRSDAAFVPREAPVVLPPAREGAQPLPWALLGQSRMRKGSLSHADLLNKIDGKTIEISGYTHFLGDEPPAGAVVLVEMSFGCWHCDMPGLPGLLDLYMADGQNLLPSRDPVKLRGKLRLNRDNPEDYLFRLEEGRIVDP